MRHLLFSILFIVGRVGQLLAQPTNIDCASAALLCAGQPLNGNNTGAPSFPGFCPNTAVVLWYTFNTNSIGGPVTLTVDAIDCPEVPGMDNELSAVILGGDGSCEISSFFAASACASDGDAISVYSIALAPSTQYWVMLAGVLDNGSTMPAQCGFNLTVSGEGVDVIGVDMSAGPDVTINLGESAQLQGFAPNADWQPLTGLSANGIADPFASPDTTTLYTLTTTINGCTFTDDVLVTVIDPSSVGDNAQVDRSAPFPDPGSDHFTMLLDGGTHIITLLDATGRRVSQQRTADERVVIRTEELQSGTYVILITSDDGAVARMKWMKQ